MNRLQKENLVQNIGEKLAGHEGSFVVNYQGMTVSQLQQLRFALEEKSGEMQVAKNRLIKIAIKERSEYASLGDVLQGQNAIIYAKSDLTGVAKVLYDFAKEHEELDIVAGCYDSHFLDKKSVKALAKLPSREVLLAQLCGTLQAPIAGFATVLRQLLVKTLLTLKAIAEKKEKAS